MRGARWKAAPRFFAVIPGIAENDFPRRRESKFAS
jgi:hypothetical protein